MSSPASTRAGLALVMVSALSWGTVGVTTQALYRMSATNPSSVGFFRLALAVPALLAAGWMALGPGLLRVGRRDLGVMALLGAMTALYQLCFFASIREVGVTVASVITLCSAPVLVAVLSAAVLAERPGPRVLGALLLALLGTALLALAGPVARASGSVVLGALLALGSALGYAVVALTSRRLAGRCHPLQTVALGFSVGAALLFVAALPVGLVVSYPPLGWVLLLYLGLVPTALAYVLFVAGLRTVGATAASIATLLEPLTSAALAWLLFGERLGLWGGAGALLLLGAMAVLALGGE